MGLIPDRLKSHHGVKEVAGLLLLLLALLSIAALVSYDPHDPSYGFHARPGAGATSNWVGRVGATLAEGLLQLFGTAAFLFPLGIGVLGWKRLRDDFRGNPWIGLLSTTCLGLALCSLLGLSFGHILYRGQLLPAGGYVGDRFGGMLVGLFNVSGALLVAATFLVAVVVLTSRFSFVRSLELAAYWSRIGGKRLWTVTREMIDEYRQRAGRRPAEDPPVDRAGPTAAPPAKREPVAIRLPLEAPRAAKPAERPEKAKPAPARPTAAPPRPFEPPPPKQAALPMEPPRSGYRVPPVELLNEAAPQMIESENELLDRARQITDKLQEFAVLGQVVAIHPGPVVTTFEFKPEAGVKYSKITGMNDDLSLALKAESVRIDRMAGRATVAIEVPNRRQETIFPRDLMSSERFRNSASKLTLALGKDINGDVFTAELERMPHLLIAGATGAGKSVGLNGMIASILYKATPDQVRMIMIDTKMIELGIYAGIPHLLIPVVTDAKHASTALKWACREMERRYRKLASIGVRNLAQFNKALEEDPERTMNDPKTGEPVQLEPLPQIVIVIDELADLMMIAAADVEASIMRLAQMARAVGIHLIIATQRPSVDVITGTIKANFPSRIAFRVSQRVDSRTIIDQQGAEHLLGRGDMLFLPPGSSRLMRVHGSLITEAELNRITTYIKKMAEPVYDDSVLRDPDEKTEAGFAEAERDEMYLPAVRTVIQEGKCSITLIQRRLQLGYARAARIVDMMEQEGVVSPGEGSKPREILVGADYLDQEEAQA
jgi:S-DNA-T family DNA segregation ATPase FtsK/SpoIIIE